MAYVIRHIPTGLYVGNEDDGDHLTAAEAPQYCNKDEAEELTNFLANPAHEFEVLDADTAPDFEETNRDNS